MTWLSVETALEEAFDYPFLMRNHPDLQGNKTWFYLVGEPLAYTARLNRVTSSESPDGVSQWMYAPHISGSNTSIRKVFLANVYPADDTVLPQEMYVLVMNSDEVRDLYGMYLEGYDFTTNLIGVSVTAEDSLGTNLRFSEGDTVSSLDPGIIATAHDLVAVSSGMVPTQHTTY